MRRAGQLRDEIAHRGELHPRAEIRNQQADPQQAKIAKSKRRENRRAFWYRGLVHSRVRTASTIVAALLLVAQSRRIDQQIVAGRIAEIDAVPVAQVGSPALVDAIDLLLGGLRIDAEVLGDVGDAARAGRIEEDPQNVGPPPQDRARTAADDHDVAVRGVFPDCLLHRAQHRLVEGRLGRELRQLRRREFEAGQQPLADAAVGHLVFFRLFNRDAAGAWRPRPGVAARRTRSPGFAPRVARRTSRRRRIDSRW